MIKIVIAIIVVLVIAVLVLGFILGYIPWLTQHSTITDVTTENAPALTVTDNVTFALEIISISGGGFSRSVSARLTNVGTADAHNVWGKIEAFYQSKKINLSGRDYVQKDIGLLAAGNSITTNVTLSFSIIDAIKISQNGVRLVLTVFSDEFTQIFYYDYAP
ncbi:MAG: hypothetical protein A2Z74_06380 [Chloroflexi bacterium RBG_13_46_9]|nr:MAG: hypothetical protein A2Z74_06380 [Chloroflexi bacterium RBG_13_46_9]